MCGPQRATPLLRKPAMGAQHWVPWQEEPDAAAAVRACGEGDGALDRGGRADRRQREPAAMQPRLPVVLVLGDERRGISPEMLACADQAVAIPMLGMANSLNVAGAAGGACGADSDASEVVAAYLAAASNLLTRSRADR
jgi:tRNA G18 (ribose-2'-O)-methylase SpoU